MPTVRLSCRATVRCDGTQHHLLRQQPPSRQAEHRADRGERSRDQITDECIRMRPSQKVDIAEGSVDRISVVDTSFYTCWTKGAIMSPRIRHSARWPSG